MQFQKLIISLILSLFTTAQAQAKGEFDPCNYTLTETCQLHELPGGSQITLQTIDEGDTVICYDPEFSAASTTLVLGDSYTHVNQAPGLHYLQNGYYTPLTHEGHAGSHVVVQVDEFSYRTHAGKTYSTSSDDSVLQLTVTEYTSTPEWHPLGIQGTYYDLHTGTKTNLSCKVIKAYN